MFRVAIVGTGGIAHSHMAASLEECDAMLRARDERGKLLSVIKRTRDFTEEAGEKECTV